MKHVLINKFIIADWRDRRQAAGAGAPARQLHRFTEVVGLMLDAEPLRRASAAGRGGSIIELPRRFGRGGARATWRSRRRN